MRSRWKKVIVGLVVVGVLSLSAAMGFAGVLKIVIASHVPPKYTDIFPLTKVFVDDINSLGAGKVKVQYYHSGTLLKVKQLIPGLISGTADMIFLTTSHCTGSWPIIGGESLPFLSNGVYDLERKFKIGSPLFNFVNKVLEKKHGIMMLANGLLPLEHIWTNKPIREPSDLKGLTIRVGGKVEAEALEALGASPVMMSSAELYEALHRHTIDGVVSYPGTIHGRSLYEVVKYNINVPIGAYGYAIWIRKKTWDSFPKEVRHLIYVAAVKYDYFFLANAKKVEKEKYLPDFNKAGIKTITPSAAAMKDFKAKVKPVWGNWAKSVGEDVGKKFIELATE